MGAHRAPNHISKTVLSTIHLGPSSLNTYCRLWPPGSWDQRCGLQDGPGWVFLKWCLVAAGRTMRLAMKAIAKRPAITNIVVLYRPGVGSGVPGGAISINLAMVTVLASASSSRALMGAPNFLWKAMGRPWRQGR